MSAVYVEVWRDGRTGRLQVCIAAEGSGGYRLLGPKFSGSGALVDRAKLSAWDAEAIRPYLDLAAAPPPAVGEADGG